MAALAEAAASVRTAVDCRPHAPPTELAALRGRQARPVRRSCGRSGYTSGAARSSRNHGDGMLKRVGDGLSSVSGARDPGFVEFAGDSAHASSKVRAHERHENEGVGRCELIGRTASDGSPVGAPTGEVPLDRYVSAVETLESLIQLRLVLSLGFVAANENQLDGRVVCHYRDGGPREASSQLVETRGGCTKFTH